MAASSLCMLQGQLDFSEKSYYLEFGFFFSDLNIGHHDLGIIGVSSQQGVLVKLQYLQGAHN